MRVERARVETRRLPNDWALQVDRSIDLTIVGGDVIPYAAFSGSQATTIELKPDYELVISLVGPDDTTAHFVWPVDAGDSWTTVDGGTSSKPCE
jgi:hypothetical protein